MVCVLTMDSQFVGSIPATGGASNNKLSLLTGSWILTDVVLVNKVARKYLGYLHSGGVDGTCMSSHRPFPREVSTFPHGH